MDLAAHIEVVLLADPGVPKSVSELAAEIPGSAWVNVEFTCYALRARLRLGRNGAGTSESPYRFYLKNDLPADQDASR